MLRCFVGATRPITGDPGKWAWCRVGVGGGRSTDRAERTTEPPVREGPLLRSCVTHREGQVRSRASLSESRNAEASGLAARRLHSEVQELRSSPRGRDGRFPGRCESPQFARLHPRPLPHHHERWRTNRSSHARQLLCSDAAPLGAVRIRASRDATAPTVVATQGSSSAAPHLLLVRSDSQRPGRHQ
jgi:hypothetical protein